MNPISTAERQRMRDAQLASMPDLCRILRYSAIVDDLGQEVASWGPDVDLTPCGWYPKGGDERRTSQDTSLVYDGTLRLPHGTALDPRDRVQLVQRGGEDLSQADAVAYGVVGPVAEGPSAIACHLRRIEP